MSDSDFGSAFPDPEVPPPSSSATSPSDEPLRITLDDVERATALTVGTPGSMRVEVISPQRLAAERYGVTLSDPDRGEELFVGVARNPNNRAEEEQYWPFLATEARRRQIQIFTFEVEQSDHEGNPIVHTPVEIRGHQISGVLPSDGTPVAVYGMRDRRDGVVRTYRIINLRTQSSIQVTRDRCFVATAVYGSLDAPQVVILRGFRDRQLMSTRWGRWAVRAYYWLSPPLASWVISRPYRQKIARTVLDTLTGTLNPRSGGVSDFEQT